MFEFVLTDVNFYTKGRQRKKNIFNETKSSEEIRWSNGFWKTTSFYFFLLFSSRKSFRLMKMFKDLGAWTSVRNLDFMYEEFSLEWLVTKQASISPSPFLHLTFIIHKTRVQSKFFCFKLHEIRRKHRSGCKDVLRGLEKISWDALWTDVFIGGRGSRIDISIM